MRVAILAIALLTPSAASALEIAETAFEVYHMENGEEVSEATTVVPLNPGNETCWNWYIKTAGSETEVTFTERLVMPAAPESWGDLEVIPEGQIGPLVLEQGGKIGTSKRKVTLSDGWFGHGWCVIPGDPVGAHSVEVTVDGKMIQRFDFEVVAAPGEPPPTAVFERSERRGRFSL